jgi:hypothetical protein
VQQDPYLEQEQQEEETWGGASGVGAAAAGGSSGGGVLCSLCMREIALQEVEQDCGTTLIVVPANILVQVGGCNFRTCRTAGWREQCLNV